jgi:phage/plasmid-like protein (TIGR03299 family)
MENQSKEEKVFNLLEQTKLNWTVNKLPLFAEVEGNRYRTSSFGMFRNDNNEFLGAMKDRYVAFQNFEMAETIIEASNGLSLDVVNGGQLQQGKKVYLQVELPKDVIGNSEIKRHITALNSHDGSASIGFGSSNTVVVCQNTFYKAYNDVSKFRHTSSAKQRIEMAMQDLRTAISLDNSLMESFKRMADIKANDEMVGKIVAATFGTIDVKQDEVSTRKMNQIKQVAGAITTDVNIHGANLWAIFNGITRYTNHVATTDEKKEEYLMVGQGHKTNLLAFDEIMAWVEKNTTKVYSMA